jgi:hypothetical protein
VYSICFSSHFPILLSLVITSLRILFFPIFFDVEVWNHIVPLATLMLSVENSEVNYYVLIKNQPELYNKVSIFLFECFIPNQFVNNSTV